MTADEFKAKILRAEAENSDRAGIYAEAVDDFRQVSEELTNATAKIDELTARVGQLTDTNFKLLEKVRYMDDSKSEKESEEEEEVITLADLFKED